MMSNNITFEGGFSMPTIRGKTLRPYLGLPIIMLALPLLYWRQIDWFTLLWCQIVIVFGYVAAVVDFKKLEVPNRLILAMISAWVVTIVPMLFIDITTTINVMIGSLIGFIVGGGLFLLIYLLSKKSIGGGDVKFMAALGLFLGFTGTLTVMLYGSLFAAITAGVLLMMKKVNRKSQIPLIPFLYLGTLASVFFRG